MEFPVIEATQQAIRTSSIFNLAVSDFSTDFEYPVSSAILCNAASSELPAGAGVAAGAGAGTVFAASFWTAAAQTIDKNRVISEKSSLFINLLLSYWKYNKTRLYLPEV